MVLPMWFHRDHFVYVPSQWEMTLQFNVVSHWLGTFTKWSQLHLTEQTPRKLWSFHWTEGGVWPDFVDFKHDYTQEFYRSYSVFTGKCPRTDKFRGVWPRTYFRPRMSSGETFWYQAWAVLENQSWKSLSTRACKFCQVWHLISSMCEIIAKLWYL